MLQFPRAGQEVDRVQCGEDLADLRCGSHLLEQLLQPIEGALTQRPANSTKSIEFRREGMIGARKSMQKIGDLHRGQCWPVRDFGDDKTRPPFRTVLRLAHTEDRCRLGAAWSLRWTLAGGEVRDRTLVCTSVGIVTPPAGRAVPRRSHMTLEQAHRTPVHSGRVRSAGAREPPA